jgi:hypothetical protein
MVNVDTRFYDAMNLLGMVNVGIQFVRTLHPYLFYGVRGE